MKRWIVVATLLCAFSLQARADEASKRAKVEQLFTVMKIDQMSNQILNSVRRQMTNMSRSLPDGQQMTPEQRRLLTEFQTKVLNLVQQQVSWKALEPEMITLYANAYSEAEIDGLINFYKSPVGQAMLAKAPELAEKSVGISQGKLAGLQPQIQQLSQQFGEKFRAAGAPPASSSPAPGKAPAPSATPSPSHK